MLQVNILLLLAVLPGAFLAVRIYQMDKIEKEPKGLIGLLLLCGATVVFPIAMAELLGDEILGIFFEEDSMAYIFIENFFVIALCEEVGKFIVLRAVSWKHPAFNFRFDGIVYAVSVGMGFAIMENLFYVFSNGIATALLRAVTSIPGHAIFAIYMGHYYGLARYAANYRVAVDVKRSLIRCLLIPIALHGFYDFTASIGSAWAGLAFLVFVIFIEIRAFITVHKLAKQDRPIV